MRTALVRLARWNGARIKPLFRMVMSFRRPVVIAAAIATICAAALILVNHTNLIIDKRPPLTPPGTTFHAVKDAGAEMTPTQPESPVKVSPAGPEPLTPPSGKN